jgi:ferredoxin
VKVPGEGDGDADASPIVPDEAPDFVKKVTAMMMAGKGDLLPVSALPPDGGWPTATTKWEKRNIAKRSRSGIPRSASSATSARWSARTRRSARRCTTPTNWPMPLTPFKSVDYKAKDFKGKKFTIQVAPEDCTGCNLCVNVCPAKDKAEPKRKAINMQPQLADVERERANYDFFLDDLPRRPHGVTRIDVKGSQFFEPLFEYNGACAGCGETPYVKLLTPAVRRPGDHRQRHRLLVDLRRQPADHALLRRRTGAGRPGRTRCSRTTPSSASGMRLAVDSHAERAEGAGPDDARRDRRRRWSRAAQRRPARANKGSAQAREAVSALKDWPT